MSGYYYDSYESYRQESYDDHETGSATSIFDIKNRSNSVASEYDHGGSSSTDNDHHEGQPTKYHLFICHYEKVAYPLTFSVLCLLREAYRTEKCR